MSRRSIVLPLLGSTFHQTIRVTPELSADGPYVYGNYQFDLKRKSATTTDGKTMEVFLIRLDLPLNATRYNGTYPIPFRIDYVSTDGQQMQQTFTVQLTISDGKKLSSGGGGGQSSVKKPVLLVDHCAITPAEVSGGENLSVQLTVINVGNREAKNIRISVSPDSEYVQLRSDLNAQFIDLLKIKETIDASFYLCVLPGAPAGTVLLNTLITYEDKYGGSYTEEGRYRIGITQPSVSIAATELTADTVNGGDNFTASVTLQNTGNRAAEKISLQFLPEDDSIRLKGVQDTRAVLSLAPNESVTLPFELRALPSAAEGAHTFGFHLRYEDKASGGVYEEDTQARVTVLQKASLGYDDVRLPESIVSGESFGQPVCVYNTGFAPIYNVRCELKCEGLICSSAFFGNLAPQDSADKTITVFVTTLSNSQKYGETSGSFEITYEDAEGQKFNEISNVRMTILEPVKQTDAEKEKEKQKIEEQHVVSQWWISLLIGIALIAILVCVIIIGKFARMMRIK